MITTKLLLAAAFTTLAAAHPFRVAALRYADLKCAKDPIDPISDWDHEGLAWDEGVCGNGKTFWAFKPIWDLRYQPTEKDPTAYGNCSVKTFRDNHCRDFLGAAVHVSASRLFGGWLLHMLTVRQVNTGTGLGPCYGVSPLNSEPANSFMTVCVKNETSLG